MPGKAASLRKAGTGGKLAGAPFLNQQTSMNSKPVVIDAWMQHPTPLLLNHPMLDSLKRWVGQIGPVPYVSLAMTLVIMDAGNVSFGLISAWHGPQGVLISSDDVAGWVSQHPDRLAGICSVDLARPMGAVRELRR